MAICSNDERDSGSQWRTAINTYIEQACPIDSATKSSVKFVHNVFYIVSMKLKIQSVRDTGERISLDIQQGWC